MNSYIINFGVYSFAMIGFLAAILFVYKKSVSAGAPVRNKDFLKVDNMLRLSPAKTLYVIKAGNEKFLIAGDAANTTMLAKLDNTQAAEETSAHTAEFHNKDGADKGGGVSSNFAPFNIPGFLREKAMQALIIKKEVCADTVSERNRG